ncbi:polymer-forming cytoskeletal protein [Caballeronia sp. EK]|uniref:bactofilin family protein n=1 Tax=Caballeronia sp. EK TaxID=2767469 RepID=UPI00165568B6|nr:polymer-forming cytoskeletal protein [Caballeronia sp. EK]MBC8641582.1 polymer-forming cytoskeletal protein [Caballeronia sp. EK]
MAQQSLITRVALNLGLVKRAPAVRMQSVNDTPPPPRQAAAPAATVRRVSASIAPPQRSVVTAPAHAERADIAAAHGTHPVTEMQPTTSNGARAVSGTGAAVSRASETDIHTVLPHGATFTGDMVMAESFLLKCMVTGNVTLEGDAQMVMTDTGRILGTLRASVAVVGGQVDGDVFVDRLIVRGTGTINGNVHYSSIAMEEGAQVNGQLTYVVPNVVGSANGEAHPELQHATHADIQALRAVPAPVERAA